MDTWVLFHGPYCRDGFAAALAANLKLGHEAKYVPIGYDEELPDIPDNSRVYMLDVSRPRDIMDELSRRCHFTIIDHHATSRRACEGADYAIFDMTKSGAVLAWEYFHKDKPVPELFLYIQDRDLWKNKLPRTKEINIAIKSFSMNFNVWETWLDPKRFQELIPQGAIILAYQHQLIEDILNLAETQNKWVFVNSSCLMSELGHELLERFPEAEVACVYWQRADRKWQYSLRSRPGGVDVSRIAEQHGGGGHPTAAGYVEPNLGLLPTYGE